jgi:hypothetical protein
VEQDIKRRTIVIGESEFEEISLPIHETIDWSPTRRRSTHEEGRHAVQENLEFITDSSLLWDSLDEFAVIIRKDGLIRTLFAGGALVFATLGSIVYTVWTVWSGSLSASILALMPGWKLLDPLPILDQAADEMEHERQEQDDESLESLVSAEDSQMTMV